MAPIDQSAFNMRGIDVRRPTGRQSDDDQRRQFDDVYSNISDQSASSANKTTRPASADATSADDKGTSTRRGQDDTTSDQGPDANTNVVTVTTGIDLTILAAEAAGVTQTAAAPSPTAAPNATTKMGSVSPIANPQSLTAVTVSDVKLQTHLDTVTGPSANASANAAVNTADKGTDRAVETTGANAPTPIPNNRTSNDEGHDTGHGSASSFGQNTPGEGATTSKKVSEIENTASSDPAPKADPSITESVIIMPSGSNPTQAISKAITTELSQHVSAAGGSNALATLTIAPPRTLTLQLTPAGMGTVSVTMHAVGHALDLQLSVSNKDTLGTISRDREVLANSVSDQGYNLRTLVIQGSDGANVSSNNSSQGQTNAQTQSGSNRQPAQDRSDDQGRNPQSSQGKKSDETPQASVRPRADALFV